MARAEDSGAEEKSSAGVAEPRPELNVFRISIAKVIGQYFLPLLILTLLFACLLIFIIASKVVADDTTEKMALAASVQVAFGMVIGYVCVYM